MNHVHIYSGDAHSLFTNVLPDMIDGAASFSNLFYYLLAYSIWIIYAHVHHTLTYTCAFTCWPNCFDSHTTTEWQFVCHTQYKSSRCLKFKRYNLLDNVPLFQYNYCMRYFQNIFIDYYHFEQLKLFTKFIIIATVTILAPKYFRA